MAFPSPIELRFFFLFKPHPPPTYKYRLNTFLANLFFRLKDALSCPPWRRLWKGENRNSNALSLCIVQCVTDAQRIPWMNTKLKNHAL